MNQNDVNVVTDRTRALSDRQLESTDPHCVLPLNYFDRMLELITTGEENGKGTKVIEIRRIGFPEC